MVMDSKGRLFGKINIVDLAIVIVILFILLFVLTNLTHGKISPAATETIRVTFTTADDIPDIFSNAIQKGAAVRVQKSDFVFGKVTDVSITDAVFYGVSADGKWIASPKPKYKSATFTVEGKGSYANNRAVLGEAELSPGRPIALVTGMTTFYAKVIGIEKQ